MMIGRGLRLFSFCLFSQVLLSGVVFAAPTREGMAAQCQGILTKLRGLEAQYDGGSTSPTQRTDDEFYRYHLLPDDPKHLVATRDRSKSLASGSRVSEAISAAEARYQEQIQNQNAESIAYAQKVKKQDILNVQINAVGHEAIACAAEYMLNNPFEPKSGSVTSSGNSSARVGNQGGSSVQPDVNQSIALAQQNQTKGDEQARKDRRKRNDAEYQASECLSVSDQNNPASFGALTNSCSYKVNYTYCVYRPDPAAWSTAMDCEKQSFGSGSARAGAKGFGHMKGGEAVHWLACREPALALDGRFENGRVVGRCRVIGGQ